MNLLTPEEVGEQLKIAPRTVARLGIPVVRIGAGKGLLRYRQEDIDRYIQARVSFEADNVDGKKKRSRALGVQVLPTRAHLQALRLAHGG